MPKLPSRIPPEHHGGRPTKLTPEVQQVIVNAIAAGSYMETAAAAAGISQDTFNRWLRNGARAEDGAQKRFSEAVLQALAQAEVRHIAVISLASQSQWQAAAWILERRYPQRWGRIERHEQTGEGGGPILVRVVYDDSPNPELKALSESPGILDEVKDVPVQA